MMGLPGPLRCARRHARDAPANLLKRFPEWCLLSASGHDLTADFPEELLFISS